MDLYERNKSNKIIICDPFVKYTRKNSPLTFYPIGLSDKSQGNMRTLPDFLNQYSILKDHLFLKIDIEKGEYPAFRAVTKEDLEGVDCLVLEIHSLLEKKYHSQVIQLLNLLNEVFVLYHLHANNNGRCIDENNISYPDVVECTFVGKKYLELNNIEVSILSHSLPDLTIDIPNTKLRNDYILTWWL